MVADWHTGLASLETPSHALPGGSNLSRRAAAWVASPDSTCSEYGAQTRMVAAVMLEANEHEYVGLETGKCRRRIQSLV
jgi:hypothetical protein